MCPTHIYAISTALELQSKSANVKASDEITLLQRVKSLKLLSVNHTRTVWTKNDVNMIGDHTYARVGATARSVARDRAL